MNRILLTLLLTAIAFFTRAQLSVWEESDDSVFICSIAGPGIFVTNLHRTCADEASGYFNSADANVGIDNGILLTSGSISVAEGPNNSASSGHSNSSPGDAGLELLAGMSTHDACILEYDLTVMADTVRINYVFGSEEYPEYVGYINDIFAFWISGAGITDTVNIATIPGTDTAIAINNVNAYTNSEYYFSNGDGTLAPYNTDDYYIQYDGFTVPLEAKIATVPGETYHMKIALADAGDDVLDSGVFLKTGSLGSLRIAINTEIEDGAAAAKEGCSAGYVNIINETPGITDMALDYYIEGNAMNGVDYTPLSGKLIIPAGEVSGSIVIDPVADAETEGVETVKLVFYNPQSGYKYDSIEIAIEDGDAHTTDFTYTKEYSTVTFHDASPSSMGWMWTFGDGILSEEKDPVHTYDITGSYEVCLNALYGTACDLLSCKTIAVEAPLAIAEDDREAIFIYPNPVHDIINITFDKNTTNAYTNVMNTLGKILYSGDICNGMEISCAGWGRGIYIITIATEQQIFVKKIILQ